MKYRHHHNPKEEYTSEDVFDFIHTQGKHKTSYQIAPNIQAIKFLRMIKDCGLKDAKDEVDKFRDDYRTETKDDSWDKNMVKAFENRVLSPFALCEYKEVSKEHFLGFIKDAVDNMDKFHCKDYILAVEFLFKNIKANGGLEKIAEEYDKFLKGC